MYINVSGRTLSFMGEIRTWTQEGQLKIYCNGSNRTKYNLNQNDGRTNEKEVVD